MGGVTVPCGGAGMSTSMLRCPGCGRELASFELELPTASPTREVASDTPLLLRISEAARLLSLSRSTLYQLIGKGELPVIRIGRTVRVTRSALERLTSRL